MSSEATEVNSGFYFPPESILASKTLYLFLLDYHKVIDLFFFTLHLAHHADKVSLTASKALISVGRSEEEIERLKANIETSDRAARKLSEFGSLNSKNLTTNVVDSFLWFISATVQSAMRKRPEMVKTGETVRIEDIFEFSSKRELTEYLIDRKVNSLSYGGMSTVERFISESMGVSIFPNESVRTLMRIFVEVRNIQVHNRGIVNRVFLGRVTQHDKFNFVEGKRAHLGFDELVDLTRVCVQTAIDLDMRTCKKFGIKQKRYSTWRKNTASQKPDPAKPL